MKHLQWNKSGIHGQIIDMENHRRLISFCSHRQVQTLRIQSHKKSSYSGPIPPQGIKFRQECKYCCQISFCSFVFPLSAAGLFCGFRIAFSVLHRTAALHLREYFGIIIRICKSCLFCNFCNGVFRVQQIFQTSFHPILLQK